MGLPTRVRLVILGIFLSIIVALNECKKLDGYKFPVYSTPFCPRNESEWNKRSSALNCNRTNGYTCLPNEKLTELLEFCYTVPWILIEEGYCLYLERKGSYVDSYSCRQFLRGCHNTSYISKRIFEYPACISIGDGCFLAEQSCKSSPNTTHRPKTSENNQDDWLWVVIVMAIVGVFVCISSCMLYFYRKKRKFPKFKRSTDIEKNSESEEEKALIANTENENLDCSDKEFPKFKRSTDIERNSESEEEKALITNTENENLDCSDKGIGTEKNDFVYEESLLDKATFDQWEDVDKRFISSNACIEVEKKTAEQNLVIVTGHSGSGKSAIIQHVALEYRKKNWIVKPVKNIEDIGNSPLIRSNFKKIMFVFNDPFGIESLDELLFNKWKIYEETLPNYLKRAKILISCRKTILSDKEIKGLLRDVSNVVDIGTDPYKLNEKEKRNILKSYKIDEKLSEEECAEIVQTEEYFPLLCKLYSTKYGRDIEAINFFKEPYKVLEEEIEGFRIAKTKRKYCALILLIVFNNELCLSEITEKTVAGEKFEHALWLCGMDKTAIFLIKDELDSLIGYLVKKIEDTYQFYHDFVMEVTTFIVGTDFPETIIKYADIGFLRTRVRCNIGNDTPEKFTIYISDKKIDDLGERLFSEIFGERLLDVVLNPCLQNEKVKSVFEKNLKNNSEKQQMLLKKIELKTDKQKLHQTSKNLNLSKLAFVHLENGVSCLFALIIFGDTDLSLHCLNTLQENQVNLTGCSLFPAVCCNGSVKLIDWFLANNRKCLTEKWGGLSPIHIVTVFHYSEILKKLIDETTIDVNLKIDKINEPNPLIIPTEKDTEINTGHKRENSIMKQIDTRKLFISTKEDINQCLKEDTSSLFIASFDGCDSIVKLLLKNGADINLCKEDGISPLHVACQKGHEGTVQLLLSNEANINLCEEEGASPLYLACRNGHDKVVELLLNNGADINIFKKNGVGPLTAACFNGHDSTVKLLLRNGADINLCMEDIPSPLTAACTNGHDSTVQLLLSNGANINLCMLHGASPLFMACQNGHNRTVQLLLSNGADINLCKTNGAGPLFIASQNGQYSTVQLLLSKGADINLCMTNGAGPLLVACENGHDSTVQLLLSNGADINLCEKEGASPLYVACENGHESTVQLLLSNGADINLCEEEGASPLYIACQNGHDSTVQLLLSNGADINLCKKNGVVPLYIACQNGHDSTVQLLLSNGADINLCEEEGASPLYIACQNGHNSTVQLLLSNGADINLCMIHGAGPLHVACENGHESTVQLLLSNGADINLCEEDGASPLYIASRKGHESTVQLLLSKGADINLCMEEGASPLTAACFDGHESTVQLLLSKGAGINLCMKNGTSPLFMACQNGHESTVQLLLSNGADINLCEEKGASPLTAACFHGHESTVQLLLSKGADINLCMTNGASPLHIACENGHESTVQLLLKNGANINLCKEEGASPLYFASQNGHDSTVQLLLSNGADINLCEEKGASPLYIASQNGHDSTVKLLLSNGADINLCEEDGESPLYTACDDGHESTVKLLLKYGADINLCNRYKLSPLYLAFERRHIETVNVLLNNCVDTSLACGWEVDPALEDCLDKHDSTAIFLLQNDNISNNMYDPDSYFSLFVSNQVERVTRLMYLER